MRRRKNQIVDMGSKTLPRYAADQESKSVYKKEYQKAYKEEYRKKTKDVRITLSIEEYERIKTIAHEGEKKPMTKYIMDNFYAKEQKDIVLNEAYREVSRHLSKMGNNLNQIAFRLSRNKMQFLLTNTKGDLKAIRNELKELMGIIQEGKLIDA
jgi:hypothetical protein